MVVFENRSAAYVWVREHRKRRKLPFAGQHQLNVDWPQPRHLVAGPYAQRRGHIGIGIFEARGQHAARNRARLSGQVLRKSGALADTIADPARLIDKAAPALFGADDAFGLQGREGPADGMPIGGKAIGQFRLPGKPFARQALAADNVEPDGIGNAPPEGDTAEMRIGSGHDFCHCKFTRGA
jgi:hypothetical protein